MRSAKFSVTLLVTQIPLGVVRADGFALRDGDTVVFLGDSITAARTCGRIIENYSGRYGCAGERQC